MMLAMPVPDKPKKRVKMCFVRKNRIFLLFSDEFWPLAASFL
ncbi:hypothetical protein [Dictyobacter formicarum]|nr:hypothetical protein [Dictyobacter formicarum]